MKKSKTTRIVYWSTTLITVFWMYSGGIAALSDADFMVSTIRMLGYPSYFHYLLGVAKLIGVTLILLGPNRYLKAFAYAGVFYEVLSASFSYAASGFYSDALIPFVFLAIAIVSCVTWFQRNNYHIAVKHNLPVKTVKNFRPELVADKKFVKIYKTFQVEEKNLTPLEVFRGKIQKNEERELFIINLNQRKIGITLWHLAYHHLAQGKIDQQNFLITFCPVCNSGMLFNPMVNGQKLDFYVSGVYRGTMIMSDSQTNSFWDHVTGECLHGFYGGEKLEIMGSHEIILEKNAPLNLPIALPKLTLFQKLVTKMQNGHTWRKVPEGKFYPGFKESFEFEDNRRPEKELGLGVVHKGMAKFYPYGIIKSKKNILDTLKDMQIAITMDEETAIPKAFFTDTNFKPTQIFMRWYGFVQTFKQVEVYSNT